MQDTATDEFMGGVPLESVQSLDPGSAPSEFSVEQTLVAFLADLDRKVRLSFSAVLVLALVIAVNSLAVSHLKRDESVVARQSVPSPPQAAVIIPPKPSKSFQQTLPLQTIQVSSYIELKEQLKKFKLWDVSGQTEIPPIVFAAFPENIGLVGIEEKKKAFLHTLLPVAMVAQSEVYEEKRLLQTLLERLDLVNADLDVRGTRDLLQERLNNDEIHFLTHLSDKYRTTDVIELIHRVNVVPVSLIMAQGALESSWGSSRFASRGNNLFGIWTWGERGMVPAGRDQDKRHKLAIYDSILHSVREYILMLNRLPAYGAFRKIRANSMDSMELAEGLLYYSTRRAEYVGEVREIIRYNRLREYDTLVLAQDVPPDGEKIDLTGIIARDKNVTL